jgi:hypothetical protein
MDPAKLHQRLSEAGKEMARTKAYQTTTDRLRKQVRARYVVANINMGMTLGKAEHCALLEDEYINACEIAEKAEEDAGIAAVEYAAAQAWFEAWRSLEATERAKINLR